jgi:nucleotide-binding universal stress UspA family protein
MFEKVMVAVDGSEYAERILNVAIDIALKYDTTLLLVHAIAHYQMWPDVEHLVEDSTYDIFRKTGQKIAQEILDKSEQQVKDSGISSVHKFAIEGKAETVIIEKAKTEQVGLIVVGTRGQSGFNALILGSVAHKVTTLATCPVLVVK